MKRKNCAWCGDSFVCGKNASRAKFCCKSCSTSYWTERKRQKRTGDYSITKKYGSHGFDRWVNACWTKVASPAVDSSNSVEGIGEHGRGSSERMGHAANP